MSFACNIGNPVAFKVIQYNTDPHKHIMVVNRGVAVPCNLSGTGYNSALAPKSDAYFPEVQFEGGTPSTPAKPVHQVDVDPPAIFIDEGLVNRHKP